MYRISPTLEGTKHRVLAVMEKEPEELVCYSTGTCWWCILRDNPYKIVSGPGKGIPLDPCGAVLLQAPIKRFLECGLEKPEHYGKHGLQAFWLSYQGMVIKNNCGPWAFKKWKQYNNLIDYDKALAYLGEDDTKLTEEEREVTCNKLLDTIQKGD